LPPVFALAAWVVFRLLTKRAGRVAGREFLWEVALLLAPLEWAWRELPFLGVQAVVADLAERLPEEDGRTVCLFFPLEPFPLAEPVPARRTGWLTADDCAGLRFWE
jgi:hypothetical protein